MAADAYLPYWSLLRDRVDLLIFDLRSHGWNPEADPASLNFSTFIDDLDSVLRATRQRFGEKPATGVFHSVTALIALLFEQMRGGFASLVLFDPPIQQPGRSPDDLLVVAEHMSRGVRRSRDWFESREEYAAHVGRNPAYQRVLPGIPALMAETLLRPDGEGYALRCPKEHEAADLRVLLWLVNAGGHQAN